MSAEKVNYGTCLILNINFSLIFIRCYFYKDDTKTEHKMMYDLKGHPRS